MGSPKGGAPKCGAQNFALFFPFPAPNFALFLTLKWSSWNFGGVFEAPPPSNVSAYRVGRFRRGGRSRGRLRGGGGGERGSKEKEVKGGEGGRFNGEEEEGGEEGGSKGKWGEGGFRGEGGGGRKRRRYVGLFRRFDLFEINSKVDFNFRMFSAVLQCFCLFIMIKHIFTCFNVLKSFDKF